MKRFRIDDLYSSIGDSIRQYREALGITQQKLAEDSGLTRTSVVHIEKGKQRMPIDRLYRIAAALGVGVVDILPIKTKGAQLDLLSKDRVNATQFSKIEKLFEGVNHDEKTDRNS
jgi:transcriptional regulator with XRE-family HTH domain